MLATCHDALVQMIQDMTGLGMPLPPARPAAGYDPRFGIAAALDVLLGSIEFLAPHYENWLEMAMLTATVCASDRPGRRDGESPAPASTILPLAPEKGAAPVKIVAIARMLGTPYSTTRRHATAMLRSGVLARSRSGLLASESWMARPTLIQDSRTVLDHIRQIFGRLAAAGFPFDAPAAHYSRPVCDSSANRSGIATRYAIQ